MSDNQDSSGPGPGPSAATSLPPEAIELASRMYNAARQGDKELLTQAVSAGLPPNMTNDKGDTLVRSFGEVAFRGGPFCPHPTLPSCHCAPSVCVCKG